MNSQTIISNFICIVYWYILYYFLDLYLVHNYFDKLIDFQNEYLLNFLLEPEVLRTFYLNMTGCVKLKCTSENFYRGRLKFICIIFPGKTEN